MHRRKLVPLGLMVIPLSLWSWGGLSSAAEGEVIQLPPPACHLLSEPEERAKLGAALEIKLMIQCGEITSDELERLRQRQPDVPDAAPSGMQAPGIGTDLGPQSNLTIDVPVAEADILINDPALDTGGTTQSETSVVVVGNTICAAWNDSGEGFAANGFSGFGYSTDGGETWTDGGPFPNGPGPDRNYGDPSLAYSERDATFFYAALSDQGLSLWESTDGCQSFSYVGAIHVGSGDDKELMAVDNDPASPYYGRIYVGWTNFSLASDRNVVSYSNNGGSTWSSPVQLPGSGTAGQGMWPAVAPGGEVYFALLRRGSTIGSTQDQWIYRSPDGGASWFKMADIATGQLRPENTAASTSCGRQALNGDIRNLSSPQIVIHPDPDVEAGYVIHAIYPYDSDGTGADESNVFYRRSTDGAFTWSSQRKLNDDSTTTDQWYPAIGVNEAGVLVASWYDRRLDTTNNLRFDRYAAYSEDGGLTWSENFRVSSVSSPVSTNNPHFDGLAICYHGDYDQVAVDDGMTAHFVWSDDRRVTETGPNPDIYYNQSRLVAPVVAPGARLFGTTGQGTTISTLVELDPATGDLIRTIGSVGYVVNGLVYDQTTGTLYGGTSINDPTYNGLIEIDTATGAGSEIGVDGWGLTTTPAVTNITVDSTGAMYGWWEGGDDLVAIDKGTGAATVVGDSGLGTARYGLAFDSLDNLYLYNAGGDYYRIDPGTGAASAVVGDTDTLAHHGDFSPANIYYGIDSVTAGGPRNLVLVDLAAETVTWNLPTVSDLHTLAFAPAVPKALPPGTQLYGTTGAGSTPSTLVELDPSTGALISTIGPVGYTVNGLVYDPSTGKLFGATRGDDPNFNGLIEIDLQTGAGTPVGLDGWGLDGGGASVTNLTVDANGQLYGWWDPLQDDLVVIDKGTGVATRVGESGVGTARYGLSFDNAGNLILYNLGGPYYRVDPSTGAATLIGNSGATAHHGDFPLVSNVYYGINATAGPRELVLVDLSSATVIDRLPTVDGLHTLAFVNKGRRVAVLGSPGRAVWNHDVRDKLLQTGFFSEASIVNIATRTPSLAELLTYDSVLVFSDSPGYADATAFGDNLADYVDAGGGVVAAAFATASLPFGGRFDSGNFWVIEPSTQTSGTEQFLGTIHVPDHPILQGVSSFSGGTNSYRCGTCTLASGAARIADWTDGRPLIATRVIGETRRADLSFYPPSSDARSDFWRTSTNGALIMANALLWVTGDTPPTLAVTSDLGTAWRTVRTPTPFVRTPVVIASPPTFRDEEPTVVRLRNVSRGGFQVRLQEWDYLDGAHPAEGLAAMVFEQGRTTWPDGTVTEAGTFSLGGTGVWSARSFASAFPAPPRVFLTVQTFNGAQAVTVRARNVTAIGFEAALFEQESLMDGHAAEQVGYLAVYSPTGTGSIPIDGVSTAYSVRTQSINDEWEQVAGIVGLKVEEEQSADAEVLHVDEVIAILTIDGLLFAQDTSTLGFNTAALRQVGDEDLDGIPDWWEYAFCGGIACDPSADDDGDGLDNQGEYESFTDPLIADSDGDGQPDGLDSNPTNPTLVGSEQGETALNHNWSTVELPTLFEQPVVIAGPPTFNGSAPGVVRIRNVTPYGFDAAFEVRFQEWAYLDGTHATEDVPHLVLEEGVHTMLDGSIWEVGTFSLNGTQAWQSRGFTDDYPGVPHLFLTLQTSNGGNPVTARARNVTTSGFEVALFHEEALAGVPHTTETVGYLAIYSPSGSGETHIGGQPQPYLLQRALVDERWTPVLSSALKVEEEQSADNETGHADETLDVLGLGPQLFAQQVTDAGADPTALRRLAPEYSAPLEWGTVTGVTDAWVTVPLAKSYTNPVVVAKVAEQTDAAPGVIRVRQAAPDSFQMRFQEWNYLDGIHGPERVFYLVAEAGSTTVAGLNVEAGRLNTNRVLPVGPYVPVAFTQSFTAPALLSGVMTYNGADAVTTRVQGLSASGFQIVMQEQESLGGHVTETLGWIAIEEGTGTTNDGRDIEMLVDAASNVPVTVPFSGAFDRRFPVVLADMITTNGIDPATTAQENLTPSSVDVFIQEEASADPETTHTTEAVSVFAAE